MKKLFLFLFILFFSSKTQLFAQNKISSSVLQGDNLKRTFPKPYYDSIKGELIHPLIPIQKQASPMSLRMFMSIEILIWESIYIVTMIR